MKILFGADVVDSHAVVTANINGNSPLVWDETRKASEARLLNRTGTPQALATLPKASVLAASVSRVSGDRTFRRSS